MPEAARSSRKHFICERIDKLYTGLMPALLTPFTPGGQINQEMLVELTDQFIDLGFQGLYLCGSTGEGLLLSEAERQEIVETVVTAVKERVPVIVHVGDSSSREAERLAAHARESGADAIASIPPFAYQFNQREIAAYYRGLKSAADLPLYFYNIPEVVNTTLDVKLARELFLDGVIQGMKYTHHDMATLRQIMDACNNELNVFSGPDDKLLPFLALGVDGGIGTTYNCMPELYLGLYEAWEEGQVERARDLQNQANRVISVMATFSIIPALKSVMRMLGKECGDPRRPFLPLSDQQTVQLEEMLDDVGFFSMKSDYSL